MHRHGRHICIVVAALLALAAALSACGKDEVSGSVDAVAKAAEHTAKVDGVRLTVRGEVRDLEDAPPIPFTGGGEMDMAGRRGYIQMDMSAVTEIEGAGEDLGDASDWQLEMVMDGTVMYMRFPIAANELPDGKRWMKIDMSRAFESAGMDASVLSVGGGDPTQQLEYLKATSGDVNELGSERVRGVDTTHYEATVDLRRFPEVLPPERRESARRSIEKLIELSGTDEMKTEVWIGNDHLVRRMRMVQPMKNPATGDEYETVGTVEYYDFGARVDVDPPPEREVEDLTDVAADELR